MALDVASNGNFNTKYPAYATALIVNLACSNNTKNADFKGNKIARAISGNQMAKVHAKLDSVHNLLQGGSMSTLQLKQGLLSLSLS